MKVEFSEQMKRKDRLIDIQNEIIANRERMIAEQASARRRKFPTSQVKGGREWGRGEGEKHL
jgi:hypothetical protein